MQYKFRQILKNMAPRILSQICRDPGSRFYGSCDRNWWHYKIRDFSSIILQQAGYFLYESSLLPDFAKEAEGFQEYARATVEFWARRAERYGAFEEYYPWERGYPALAFSTLSAAKLIYHMSLDGRQYNPALAKAAKQLLQRSEHLATNQYLAGVAALFYIHKIQPELVNPARVQQKLEGILFRQSPEGWFEEYGGPDLGYLSVAIDCLWDIYDMHPHKQIQEAIGKAVCFIDSVLIEESSIGQHNARNTDYLVPYGIVRAAFEKNEKLCLPARRVAEKIFGQMDVPEHFVHALDDRYICHYTGHSFARAYALLLENGWMRAAETTNAPEQQYFSESGYYIVKTEKFRAIISARKGGNISVVHANGGTFNDYGKRFEQGRNCYVTNWWGASRARKVEQNSIHIMGDFVKTTEQNSNPLLHLALRCASLILGKSIISVLKQRMIFQRSDSTYGFQREITWQENSLMLVDRVSGIKNASRVKVAPVFSRRHVASADSFNSQNISLFQACRVKREIQEEGDTILFITHVEF
jgi:hypothetical protein